MIIYCKSLSLSQTHLGPTKFVHAVYYHDGIAHLSFGCMRGSGSMNFLLLLSLVLVPNLILDLLEDCQLRCVLGPLPACLL